MEAFIVVPGGTLVVPRTYDHASALSGMDQRAGSYGSRIVDWAKFANPTETLVPGKELEVCVCEQVAPFATFEMLMQFLEGEKAIFAGIQGAILVAKASVVAVEFGTYMAVDHLQSLWRDSEGIVWVPVIRILQDAWDVGVVNAREPKRVGSRTIFLRPANLD